MRRKPGEKIPFQCVLPIIGHGVILYATDASALSLLIHARRVEEGHGGGWCAAPCLSGKERLDALLMALMLQGWCGLANASSV